MLPALEVAVGAVQCCCSLNCADIKRSEWYMTLMFRLMGPSSLIQYCFKTERWFDNAHIVARFKMSPRDITRAEVALWTLVSLCRSPLRLHQLILIEEVFANGGSPDDHNCVALFMNERWFHNNYTFTHFKISRQYIIQAEAAMWTLFSQCELPLCPHQLILIEEVFANGGLVASPDDHDYATLMEREDPTKLVRDVESLLEFRIDKILEIASSLQAASPRMWNTLACMLDHCASYKKRMSSKSHDVFRIMVGHITDENCPSDVLPGIVEVLLVARSKYHHCERIHLPQKLQETVFAACTARDAYTSLSRRLDLLTRLVDMFVQWSE